MERLWEVSAPLLEDQPAVKPSRPAPRARPTSAPWSPRNSWRLPFARRRRKYQRVPLAVPAEQG